MPRLKPTFCGPDTFYLRDYKGAITESAEVPKGHLALGADHLGVSRCELEDRPDGGAL